MFPTSQPMFAIHLVPNMHHPTHQPSPPPLPPRPPPASSVMGTPTTTFIQPPPPEPAGPAVTVFVGNITERAPDIMMRHILSACGTVVSWKRVQGASGKLQAFGFCEYANPDAALRAIRLLHDFDIASKKLVVKADSKTNKILDEYKGKKKEAQRTEENSSPLQDEASNENEEFEYMTDDMRKADTNCMGRIDAILSEHRKDIVNYVPQPSRPDIWQDIRDKRMTKVQERISALTMVSEFGTTANLDDMDDVEEGKKEIISREIVQFREQMKKQEEEKERDRRQREKTENESVSKDDNSNRSSERPDRGEERREREDRRRDRDRDRDEERRERERDREREREKERERERDRERDRERRDREERVIKTSSRRSRSLSAETRRSRREKRHSRSRSGSPRRSDRDSYKEKEILAEEKERKEAERKIRKKELQYQERLKNWENREHKKQKELDRESEKESIRESETEREARKLKECLEDYEDDRDDPKFYKGHSFQRKLVDREHEKDLDAKDRAKEKEDLEELRSRIMAEGHDNPESAYKLACAEHEEQYKPKLLIKPNPPPPVLPPQPIINLSPQPPQPPEPQLSPNDRAIQIIEPEIGVINGHDESKDASPASPISDSDSDRAMECDPEPEPEPEIDSPAMPPPPIPQQKRKKFNVKDVFNQEDEDAPPKKKKLPLPAKDKQHSSGGGGGDEKRKHIKSLIDKIPTSKEELFAYPIDAAFVDNNLMEKRIRPWINKKIVEYIGEPESTLVDFICSKVLVGSEPQSLLNDIQMVLDDEAEVFVVKMWRLLIYEIEAKKMGLGKA